MALIISPRPSINDRLRGSRRSVIGSKDSRTRFSESIEAYWLTPGFKKLFALKCNHRIHSAGYLRSFTIYIYLFFLFCFVLLQARPFIGYPLSLSRVAHEKVLWVLVWYIHLFWWKLLGPEGFAITPASSCEAISLFNALWILNHCCFSSRGVSKSRCRGRVTRGRLKWFCSIVSSSRNYLQQNEKSAVFLTLASSEHQEYFWSTNLHPALLHSANAYIDQGLSGFKNHRKTIKFMTPVLFSKHILVFFPRLSNLWAYRLFTCHFNPFNFLS